MIAGSVIALLGFALLVYGGAVAIAFTIAKSALAFGASTEAFKRAQSLAVAKAGDTGVEWLISKVPFGFARDMIRARLGDQGASGFALSMVQDTLSDLRFKGFLTGAAGLAICVTSYWVGPWLTRTVNGLLGFGGAPA